MKVTRAKLPESYGYLGAGEELTGEDIAQLESMGIEESRYWYERSHYEGSGQILMIKGGLWYHHDMHHCSCYGPLDRMKLEKGFATLAELLAVCTEELRGELQGLVKSTEEPK